MEKKLTRTRWKYIYSLCNAVIIMNNRSKLLLDVYSFREIHTVSMLTSDENLIFYDFKGDIGRVNKGKNKIHNNKLIEHNRWNSNRKMSRNQTVN